MHYWQEQHEGLPLGGVCMALIIDDPSDMQRIAEEARRSGKRIGVVPTMGYLHEGHLSLIRAARQRTDTVVTTVFVNPVQFGPTEDFERYPRDLSRDASLAAEEGTDYVFAPDVKTIYPERYSTYVLVERLSGVLEGRSRPGHFRGVATVVAKLFNITRPHVAVFGQKDAQQVIIIRRMVQDLNFDVELLVMPTIRESDGLALSSRNSYLSPEQRGEAAVLYKSLQLGQRLVANGERSSARILAAMADLITKETTGIVDYISVADAGTLEEVAECGPGKALLISLAVRFGSTRLIDNITITR